MQALKCSSVSPLKFIYNFSDLEYNRSEPIKIIELNLSFSHHATCNVGKKATYQFLLHFCLDISG